MDDSKEAESQLNEKLYETRMKFANLWESCNPVRFKQKYGESLKITRDRCIEIYEEEKQMCDKVEITKKNIAEQNALIKKMQEDLQIANQKFESNNKQKQEMLKKIKQLKEELAKKQELISTQKQENKAKLKELNTSAEMFKKRMGLEIRRVHGEQLQFIFKCINSKNPEQLFTFLLRFNEEGNYEVMSCDPPLECMPLLQEKLKETNNLSAFLANVRKAFAALV
ncbi:kinetochore protein Spc25 [Pristis pectinata]|uniref:kinetochore protein Spc25 n=1 Tax=Pristis pectinata TaxID=685728 RepID=UPI00223E0D25|nr:kinetochore protein Spc25 [Pristis pectinata]XP_051883696.1 kinetochore protein Spc25 [Pristis pectinata]XP_051883704.1 kinetochore protein Spc25 [Pristis pectinata]